MSRSSATKRDDSDSIRFDSGAVFAHTWLQLTLVRAGGFVSPKAMLGAHRLLLLGFFGSVCMGVEVALPYPAFCRRSLSAGSQRLVRVAGAILSERDVEMRSDWGNKLGAARGWLMGAAVVVIALVYLLRR